MFENDFKRRQKGTGFTNIGRILGANVGAGQQMAGKIAQGIQTAGQNVRGQIGQAQQKFATDFKTGTQPALGAISTTSGIEKLPGESDEAYSNRIKNTGIDYSKIGEQVNQAKYTGPQGLENKQGLIGSAVNVGQLGGLTTSGLGQQQLLKQFAAGKQGYSKGQGALDQLLLGQNLSAQQQLRQAAGSVSDIPEAIRSAVQSTESQAAGMTSGINTEKGKVLKGVQSSIGDIENRAREQAQQYSRDASRLAELLKDPSKMGLATGEFGTQHSEEQAAIDRRIMSDIKKFGIDPKSMISGFDKENAIQTLQEIANKASLGQTSRYTDAQRAALQKLSQFQQDETKAGQIAAQKNKNAFALSDKDFQNLAKQKELQATKAGENKDIETGKKYKQWADEYKKIIDLTKNWDNMGYDDPGAADIRNLVNIYGAKSSRNATVRQDLENKAFTALGKKYGFTPEQIDQLATSVQTKGQASDLLYSNANKLADQNIQKQKNRAANEMSLQDYINRMYGMS